MAMALAAACGSNSSESTDAGAYDCTELSKSVQQERGLCRIDRDPDGECPSIQGAYCLPDGRESSCPSGWSNSCKGGPGEIGTECTYSRAVCFEDGLPYVDFDMVQTLNGVRGLSVLSIGANGMFQCEFRPCAAM
jgi:hypothetical protein